MKRLPLALLACVAIGLAQAHATFVFGSVSFAPDPPQAGEPFTLRITLEDPSLAPVEDAIVFVELRPLTSSSNPPPDAAAPAPERALPLWNLRLIEIAPAVYQETLELPDAAGYQLLVRDQTFPWEEANASVVFNVGGALPLDPLPFILPPTQVAPRSLWTWIIWLIGVPLVAGMVVTLLVLRGAHSPKGRTERP